MLDTYSTKYDESENRSKLASIVISAWVSEATIPHWAPYFQKVKGCNTIIFSQRIYANNSQAPVKE